MRPAVPRLWLAQIRAWPNFVTSPIEGSMRIAGIDGCPVGWLRLQSDGTEVTAGIFVTASELFVDAESFDAIAIDIPIGLPDSAPRAVDSIARKLIQPRGSSVFPAPLRTTLAAADYADACARSRDACGKALSRQAFAILPKVRDVDTALYSRPELRARVYEVHPEVSFRIWSGAPLVEPKRSGLGFIQRLALVNAVFPEAFTRIRREVSRRSAADDDILDAFAALWTASRIVQGTAVMLPHAEPPVDSTGLPMRMLA
jgi:predicted RNase H-like nuclease